MTLYACKKLNDFPFVCNRCFHYSSCSKQWVAYDAAEADHLARHRLKSARAHSQISTHELKALDLKISERINIELLVKRTYQDYQVLYRFETACRLTVEYDDW